MNIVIDSREKNGWNFSFYGCGAEVKGLKEGDYTLQEFLDIEERDGIKICRVERKASTGELAINLGSKRKQFIAEMERLSEYNHKYLILEFHESTVLEFPVNSNIPKKIWPKLRITSAGISNSLKSIENKYGITVIYAESKDEAEKIVYNIFKELYDAYKETI